MTKYHPGGNKSKNIKVNYFGSPPWRDQGWVLKIKDKRQKIKDKRQKTKVYD